MMRTKRFSQSIEPNRLRVILWGIGILLLVTVGYSLYLYFSIMQDKTDTFDQSENIAVEETPIEQVSTVYRYHGNVRYDIVAGVEPNGDEGFAFVPKQSKGSNEDEKAVSMETSYVSKQNILTEEQMLSKWRQNCQACELEKITPAIDNQKPLWEFTYIDAQDRYVFDYYYMKNGKKYEQYGLKQ